MILSFIFLILKTALSHVIKFIAWLLVSLSLWVPLVYTLIFVVAVGFSGGSLTELKNWYLFGLAISFIGSFAISTYFYDRGVKKKKQARAAANLGKVSEKQEDLGLTKKEGLTPGQPLPVLPEQNAQDLQNQQGSQSETNQTDSQIFNQYNQSNSLNNQYGQGNPQADFKTNPQTHPYNQTKSQADYEAGYQSGYQAGFQTQSYKGETAAKHGFFTYDALNNNEYNRSDYGERKDRQNFSGYGGGNSRSGQNSYGTDSYGGQGSSYGAGGPFNGYAADDKEHNRETVGFSQTDLTPASSRPMAQEEYKEYGAVFDLPVSGGQAIAENPTVFATRNDPTVFIYEYSDRLEYYKRTRSGMILMDTKSKNAG